MVSCLNGSLQPQEASPDPACEELHETLIVHVQELVQINPTVGELTEGPLLLQLSSLIVSHGYYKLSAKFMK